MRMVLGLGGLLVLLGAGPAAAGVAYEVVLESPTQDPVGRIVLRGAVDVAARAEGGLGDVESAAYHLRPTDRSWSQRDAVAMTRVEVRSFRSPQQIASGGLANGTYELEVRIWGAVPAYDPEDPNTFARRISKVIVDNAPPPPQDLVAAGSVGAVRLTWSAIATADRPDFAGYRIWMAEGPCPEHPSALETAGRTRETTFALLLEEPGERCFVVTAARTSELSGLIETPSFPVAIDVSSSEEVVSKAAAPSPKERKGSAGRHTADTPEEVTVEDGTFEPQLPYAPVDAQPVLVPVPNAEPAAPTAVSRPVASSRRSVAGEPIRAIAAGLILVVTALQIRRFLSGGRMA